MTGKRIFISGGAGFLGKHLVSALYDNNEITIYSRDEAKHYFMKKQYPKLRCIVGDVRNFDLMLRATRGHSVGIFAASLKQIEACDENTEEACQVIIHGALNSRRCAEENAFESASFISSDKSRAATTIYGGMKYVAGESFIVNPLQNGPHLTSIIYGNVTNSTGSIVPLINDSIRSKRELVLYNQEMTRFLIDIEDAVRLVIAAQKFSSCNIVPVANSFLIKDLFDIYAERFGLKYVMGVPRIGEKIHEIMASQEEVPRMEFIKEDGLFIMHQQAHMNTIHFPSGEYSSKDCVLSRDQLDEYLSKNNYFR